MSEELVKKVQDMLKEETWTRATISNYTKNNLIELAGIVESAKNEDCVDEIKEICDEQLAHTRESIIALYISGMLGLQKGDLDNSSLDALVDIFEKNHKSAIVVYLCESILEEDAANRFALRTLARCYSEDKDNSDKVWEIYEKIVKLDFEEADIAKLLAEHFESLNNTDAAVDYYKKALLRYVNVKNSAAISTIWAKLVQLIPEEYDFFMLVQRKVAKTISADKSALLLQELYNYYKTKAENGSSEKAWDTPIDLLKRILTIDPKDPWARREIANCYRKKYGGPDSKVEDYIRAASIEQNFRNIFEAINDFEKHIAFAVHNFVYHKTWHVGVISKVEGDWLYINFIKTENGIPKIENGRPVYEMHKISLKMAVDSLQPLPKEHIWAYKANPKLREKLKLRIKKDKVWTLKTIIKSFGNSCDMKKIKAELVYTVQNKTTGEKNEYGLLTSGEWTSWNNAAKKELESNPMFSKNPNNANEYIVRDHPITPEEKLSNEFKAQKQFFARLDILMRYVNDETTDKESELFADMFSYFTGFLKAINVVNEQVVASYLVVQKVLSKPGLENLASKPSFTFAELYREIANPREMFTLLKDSKNTTLRNDFLGLPNEDEKNDVKKGIRLLEDWDKQYLALFPAVLDSRLITALLTSGKDEAQKAERKAQVQQLVVESFDDFRGHRDAILFFFEFSQNESWWFKDAERKELLVPYQKQLIAILNVLSQAYREIENHVDTTENRKVIKKVDALLFENDTLINYMLNSDLETLAHLYTLADDIADLDGAKKAQLRNKILKKYPDYKFHKTEEKSAAPKGMLVTAKMLKIKQDLEKDIQTVQIPAIAKEVAEAKEKGDLKENAEYIAAREAQHKLQNDLKRLEGELARAVVFDPTTVTTSFVSFGTDVTVVNKETGAEETYTILGPWESNPENGIISYMSPFGNALMDHKVGDDLAFTINEHRYTYTVKAITLAKN